MIKRRMIFYVFILFFLSGCTYNDGVVLDRATDHPATQSVKVVTMVPSESIPPTPQQKQPNDNTTNHTEHPYAPILYTWYGNHILVGATNQTQWIDPLTLDIIVDGQKVDLNQMDPVFDATAETAITTSGQIYSFYHGGQYMTSGQCDAVTFTLDGYINAYYRISISNASAPNQSIGINVDWDAVPQRQPIHNPNNQTYQVDINQDGTMDTLHYPSSLHDGMTVYALSLEMNDRLIEIGELAVDGTYCESYSIEFLDLNGDGRLEIITAQEGHNLYLAVYDIVDANAVEALSLYIGD